MAQTRKSETLGVLNVFKEVLLYLGVHYPRDKYPEFNTALGSTYVSLSKAIKLIRTIKNETSSTHSDL